MAKIPEKMRWIYDLLLTAAILAMATVLCTLLRRIDDGSGYVNLIFVLAVATISRWTEGYFWGIFSAVSGVLFVNYVFTYPYWEFNFTITGYPFTFLAMLTVSMMISAMNTQIKKQERLRIETEKEAAVRAGRGSGRACRARCRLSAAACGARGRRGQRAGTAGGGLRPVRG